jgi:3-oxoacyl-[acyl-carrier protein] reductase
MSDSRPYDFTGNAALVTGGSRGIGAGIAIALAAAGAKVIVSGRDEAALAHVTGTIKQSGGTAHAIAADFTNEQAVQAVRHEAEATFGLVTILAACAGGGGEPKPLIEESALRWRSTLEANLTSAFFALRVFLPAMFEARRGAVITMASSAGRQPSGASSPYAAAKAGLLALTRQAAAEAAPFGVRVNAIAPSAIVTDRLALAPQEARARMAEAFPLRRLGEVKDVTGAALYLLSDAASWITGITVDIAGGRVMI